ncbi:hypothetical protein A7975_19900 [Bacillus sp. FJAT-26390]|nr:hypothetical protein A7975_19900 [Bacillus sp. FJAT-26390]
MQHPYETNTMKISNKMLFIMAGAIVVIGIVIYGSMSLYAKLNKVEELNGRLEETAQNDGVQASPESTEQPSNQAVQKPEDEPTQTPVPVPTTQSEEGLKSSPDATLTPEPTSDNLDIGHKPEDESTNTDDKSQKKKEIVASVTAKLAKLKSSCQASSNSLVQQIAEELSADKDATLSTIQSKYLNKVFAAEADCDAKFNQLISTAKSEYKAADLGDQSFPDWSSQYESAKAAARANALTVIANSLKK